MNHDFEAAIRAVIPNSHYMLKVESAIEGFHKVKEWLDGRGVFDTPERLGSLIAQCAHETVGFRLTEESLYYTSAERIKKIFGVGSAGRKRFPCLADCHEYVRQKVLLGNKVYADRMGNGDEASGDGWKFRGRGAIHLTGRTNYQAFGKLVDIDLERWPELAKPWEGGWKVAAAYMDTRKRHDLTAFEWADRGDVRAVTRIINGGLHGLKERTELTVIALGALKGA